MAGRPRLFDEARALEAAMQLFWRQGYEGTSLAQLRTGMGLSSASLYNAFASKEGLFQRVIEHYVSRPGSVQSLVGSSQHLPAAEALTVLLHRSIDEQLDASHPPGCLVALSATVGPGDAGSTASRIVAGQRGRDRQAIDGLIQRAAKEGALPQAVPPGAAAFLVHTFILGIATQIHDGAKPQELHAAADMLARLWLPPDDSA